MGKQVAAETLKKKMGIDTMPEDVFRYGMTVQHDRTVKGTLRTSYKERIIKPFIINKTSRNISKKWP